MNNANDCLPQAFVRWAKTQTDATLVGSVVLVLLGQNVPLSPKGEAYADVFSLEYTRMQENLIAKDARRKEQLRMAQQRLREKKAAKKSHTVNMSSMSSMSSTQTDITLQTDIHNITNKPHYH